VSQNSRSAECGFSLGSLPNAMQAFVVTRQKGSVDDNCDLRSTGVLLWPRLVVTDVLAQLVGLTVRDQAVYDP
jgi:hypothetical protein